MVALQTSLQMLNLQPALGMHGMSFASSADRLACSFQTPYLAGISN